MLLCLCVSVFVSVCVLCIFMVVIYLKLSQNADEPTSGLTVHIGIKKVSVRQVLPNCVIWNKIIIPKFKIHHSAVRIIHKWKTFQTVASLARKDVPA